MSTADDGNAAADGYVDAAAADEGHADDEGEGANTITAPEEGARCRHFRVRLCSPPGEKLYSLVARSHNTHRPTPRMNATLSTQSHAVAPPHEEPPNTTETAHARSLNNRGSLNNRDGPCDMNCNERKPAVVGP